MSRTESGPRTTRERLSKYRGAISLTLLALGTVIGVFLALLKPGESPTTAVGVSAIGALIGGCIGIFVGEMLE